MSLHHRAGHASPPLPSPIPTATGSRLAGTALFRDYVDRSSSNIPKLNLPGYVHRGSIPADIHYGSLVSRDAYSVDRLLRSAMDYGVFRISGHGISPDEWRSAFAEASWVFRLPMNCCLRHADREEFVWCRSNEGLIDRVSCRLIDAGKFQNLRNEMENIARKMEAVGREVAEVMAETMSNKQRRRINDAETRLSLCRYTTRNSKLMEAENPLLQNSTSSETTMSREDNNDDGYALCLHLVIDDHGEFFVQSKNGSICFRTRSDSIVVTLGDQLRKWSMGEFSSVYGKLNFDGANLQREETEDFGCLLFKLNCTPPSLNNCLRNAISINSQILFVLLLALLCKCYLLFRFD